MSDQETASLPPQIRAMNEARVRALAQVAAHDPDKVRRAANIIRAALAEGTITLDELTGDNNSAGTAAA